MSQKWIFLFLYIKENKNKDEAVKGALLIKENIRIIEKRIIKELSSIEKEKYLLKIKIETCPTIAPKHIVGMTIPPVNFPLENSKEEKNLSTKIAAKANKE